MWAAHSLGFMISKTNLGAVVHLNSSRNKEIPHCSNPDLVAVDASSAGSGEEPEGALNYGQVGANPRTLPGGHLWEVGGTQAQKH